MRDVLLVPTREVARLLGIAPHTLRQWRARGADGAGARLPYVRLGGPGGRVAYRLVDLEAWISAHTPTRRSCAMTSYVLVATDEPDNRAYDIRCDRAAPRVVPTSPDERRFYVVSRDAAITIGGTLRDLARHSALPLHPSDFIDHYQYVELRH